MRVDYTRRPSPAEGVSVDPEDYRKVPSHTLQLYRLFRSRVERMVSQSRASRFEHQLGCVRHSLASLYPSRNITARKVDSPRRKPSSRPSSHHLDCHRNLAILHQLRPW